MVMVAETISKPQSRRRFLRTGLQGFSAPTDSRLPSPVPLLFIDHCSLIIERSAALPHYSNSQILGSKFWRSQPGNDPINNLDPSGHKHHPYQSPQTQQDQQHNSVPHDAQAMQIHEPMLQHQLTPTTQRDEEQHHQPPLSDNTGTGGSELKQINENTGVVQQTFTTRLVDYQSQSVSPAAKAVSQARKMAEKQTAKGAAPPSKAEQEALTKYYELLHVYQQLTHLNRKATRYYQKHPHAMAILRAEIAAQWLRVVNAGHAFYKQFHTTPQALTRSIEDNLAATREKLEKAIKTLKHAHSMATVAGQDAETIKAIQEALEKISIAINAFHGLLSATSKNPVKQFATVQDALNIAAGLLEETMPGVGSVLSAYVQIIGSVGGAAERGIVKPLNEQALHALLKPYKLSLGSLTNAFTQGIGTYNESGTKNTINNALANRNLLRQYPWLKKALERALARLSAEMGQPHLR